ncbi:MAG: DUF6465 family protein [Beduini sp.]|uniref:DUF6465 family protein n=1 Tax=Beduini sp. TaxID=1922300 RepID=UPI0011CBA668
MKTKMEIQYHDKNVITADIEKAVKEELKVKGIKMNTIDTLDIFYQPETGVIYYLANLVDGTKAKGEIVEI